MFTTVVASTRWLRRRRSVVRGVILAVAAFWIPNIAFSAEDAEQPESGPSASAPELPFRLIGATATVTEASSGLPFAARVDTGATTCSIHCEKMEIEGESSKPKENVGKPVRFLVKNKQGESKWVRAKIIDHVVVRTSEQEDERYKVQLKLRWQDVEKKVSVTLNDRNKMAYPLLLGRNFLRNDFLVNVAWDQSEAAAANTVEE